MIEYKIRIDVKGPHTFDTKVELTSGDVQAYRLHFCFYDDGQPFDASACNLIVKGKRPDGVVVADGGIIEKDGTAHYDIVGSLCAVAGFLSLEVALTNNAGAYLTTKELLFFVREGHGDGALAEEEVTPLLTQMATLINQTEVVKNDCAHVAKSCAEEETNRVQAEAERNAAVDIVMANAEAASRQAGEALLAAQEAKNEAAAAAQEATYASLAAQKAQIAAEAMSYASLTVSTGEDKEHAIDDSVHQPIVSLRLLGESVQDGVPSPDAPIEVVSVENPVVTFSNGTNEQRVTLDGITLRGLKDATGAWAARDEIVVDGKAKTVKLVKNVKELQLTMNGKYTAAPASEEYVFLTNSNLWDRKYMSNIQDSLCNYFPYSIKALNGTYNRCDSEYFWLHFSKETKHYYYISLKSSRLDMTNDETVVASANAFLEDIGAKIYYVINAVESDITNTEAGQALLSLCTYYPETSIVCDADCTVAYIADTTKAFNKLVERVAQLEVATVNNM